ncbi:MAG: transglutaminase-like domain-containing protein [Nanoarchaeota archaeon]
MRKSFYYFLGIFAVLIVVALALFFSAGGITGLAVTGHGVVSVSDIESKQVSFIFKDNKTGCSLNGGVYVDENYIGETENGVYDFLDGTYGKEVKLKGETSDCFGSDAGLGFVDYWELPSLDAYFSSEKSLVLETSLNPRNPRSLEEVQGFIRPDEAQKYLSEITKYFNNDYEADLDRIADYGIFYRYDSIIYSDSYWQTPAETIKLGRGDCEDWAVTVLSLIEKYDSNAKCYGVLWQSHMSVFCYVNNKYIIYDQGNTKVVKTLSNDFYEMEKKVELRKFLNSYFDEYGISVNGRKVQGVVNSKETKSFNDNEEFVEWLLSFDKI